MSFTLVRRFLFHCSFLDVPSSLSLSLALSLSVSVCFCLSLSVPLCLYLCLSLFLSLCFSLLSTFADPYFFFYFSCFSFVDSILFSILFNPYFTLLSVLLSFIHLFLFLRLLYPSPSSLLPAYPRFPFLHLVSIRQHLRDARVERLPSTYPESIKRWLPLHSNPSCVQSLCNRPIGHNPVDNLASRIRL